MADKNILGDKIRQIREMQKMSVEDLANNSNTSTELITQLENGALVPSLTPVMQIARALGVRLGTFLDDAPHTGPVVVKNGESDNVVRFSGNCDTCEKSTLDFFSLAKDKADRHMEPFIIDVHPRSGEAKQSSHEGEEFIYVLGGEIEILYGNDSFTLSTGDSIYYDSVVPHLVHATGSEDAKILAVVYAPY
ncbi:helix-turn-helix domain-containing protein [Methanolobus bombayensis]|uniref:helix-turn-helix domain-containing protein n=1 Tax=Methanolobus bombayensis TaxID=38023 RepID=UPI001AE8AEB8|nr:XRE family transcriptional regulator [Methanolobus bombayensis]MBP1908365.1 transcriptional regulator with XRE-family HTH domain [Methanolobus bombayensis]